MKTAPVYNGTADMFHTDLPDNPHDLDRMQSETVIMDLPEVKDIPGQEHISVMPLGEMADTTIASDDEEGVGVLDFDNNATDLDDEDDDIAESNDVVVDAGDEEEFDDEEDDETDDEDLLNDDDPEEDYEGEDSIVEDDEADFEDEDLEDDEDEEDDDITRASASVRVSGESFDESSKRDREAADAEISEEEISMIENSGPVERDSDTDALNRSRLDQTDFDGETLNEVASTQNIAGEDLDVPGAELDDDNEDVGEEDEENNVYSMADTE